MAIFVNVAQLNGMPYYRRGLYFDQYPKENFILDTATV